MDEGYLGIEDFTVQRIADIITGFACWLIGIVLAIMVIFLIVAGIRFFLARGNETAVVEARKNLTWTLVGILVILATNVIIATVSNALSRDYSFIPLNCSFTEKPPAQPRPAPPPAKQPPKPEAKNPVISSFIPDATTAGVKTSFNQETGVVTYTWLNVPFEIKGKELKNAIITSNNTGVDGKPGIEFKDLKISDTAIKGFMFMHSTAQDGPTIVTLTTPGGSATIKITVNITGTQYLQRRFKNKNVRFFGDWPKIMPDGEVLELESLVNIGLQEIDKSNYKILGIVSHIYEENYWNDFAEKKNCGGGLEAEGCADSSDNIIHIKGGVEGSVVYGPPSTIVHESAHKLHFYNLGMYTPVSSLPTNFDKEWRNALGDLNSCPHIPIKVVNGAPTWSDGDITRGNEPRCGFVRAYGAFGVERQLLIFPGKIYEDVATFEEADHFYKNFLSDKNDPRYNQKVNILKKYGF